MYVSLNELSAALRRCFEANGYSVGQYEDAANAIVWLEQHGCEQFTQQDLAELINLSERQFKRRFKQAVQQTPLAYIQALRMEVAKKALETSLKQVDVIARECGYEDVRFFRELFKRNTGLAPSEYRGKFGV